MNLVQCYKTFSLLMMAIVCATLYACLNHCYKGLLNSIYNSKLSDFRFHTLLFNTLEIKMFANLRFVAYIEKLCAK